MGDERVKLAFCFDGCFKRNSNDGRLFYNGGKVKVTFFPRTGSFNQLKAHLSNLTRYDPETMTIMYSDPELPSHMTMVDVSDDGDVANMLETPPPIAMCISNRPIDLYPVENQPSLPKNGPSTRETRSCESMAEQVVLNEGVVAGLKIDHKTEIERNIDPIESPVRMDHYEVVLQQGQEFDDVHICRNYLVDYAISHNFVLRFVKSEVGRVWAKCAADGCSWRVHCSKVGKTGNFRVRRFVNVHSCAGAIGSVHQPLARSQWVARKIKGRLLDQLDLTPRDIIHDVQREYGVTLSYQQAWRGKELALKMRDGSHEKEYTRNITATVGRPVGRPCKKRHIQTEVRDTRPYVCKLCGEEGHNRKTCKKPI
ncbi:uncharacterized protein LOC18426993 [Amborella trichopoda]|uniref:CCHC-type domain-containing protein n=1 Tax=Amborella trichopoda TaxID=13333 RepID=W1NWA9_AMBTC|nr:uncharacterized protein LOC18426993 [Amborella trichopoda]XP_011620667.1 uncharacterized protein LOC18426993 [Amborella trichopoda]XP_011620668.1 uncharacterized protein LOC18426993 [Amborella trichopoda]XP_011620670.1 uncharacterized protein LOC18426993 [Amborella trichopoda]ERM98969.1 hypothetical protein AMTR_s00226p00021430 [Amborella trichopoda]|eukprot:XP_006836116.1 uncharacterized protein LOC18426993 [Amborella trichopoda]